MMAPTESGRRAFGIRTVANAFEVSTDSVKRWVRDELVRSIQVGGRRLIPLSEVERIEREGIPRRKAR
jgi:hypothetical protein